MSREAPPVRKNARGSITMHAEFEKITGLSVGREVYSMIEDAYMASGEIDKHKFCEDYMSNNDKVLENFLKLTEQKLENDHQCLDVLSKQFADAKESFSKQLRTAKTQIDKLQAKLDEELQWTQDKTMGTNLTQNNYLEDIEDSLVKNAEPFDPVEIIVRVCGFQKEFVHLIDTVSTYEKNKYGQVRANKTYTRKPYYVSSDWNYVSFAVKGMKYELIDGELHFYYD